MVVVYTIVSRSNVYFALKSKINLKQKQLANIHDYKTLYLSISISLNWLAHRLSNIELTLPQFYELLHELERAKASLDSYQ